MKERDLFPIVVHTLIENAGRFLFLRRASTGFGDGLYQPPGGHLLKGESVTAAARRECREEAGILVAPGDLKPLCSIPYGSGGGQGVDFIFLAERFVGEARIGEPHKCDDLQWFALDALPTNVVPFLAPVLTCWRDGRWFYEFGFASGEQ